MNIDQVIRVADKIGEYCREIENLRAATDSAFSREEQKIKKESEELISSMTSKLDRFIESHFGKLKEELDNLIKIIARDYQQFLPSHKGQSVDFSSNTFKQNEALLMEYYAQINSIISELNSVDFDKLVPPKTMEANGESFFVISNGSKQEYNCDTPKQGSVDDPKPIKDLAIRLFDLVQKAQQCIYAMGKSYQMNFDLDGFATHTRDTAAEWLSETKRNLESKYQKRYTELFVSGNSTIPSAFFEELIAEGREYAPDAKTGSDVFKDKINIGDLELFITSKRQYLDYIENEHSTLKGYVKNGFLPCPLTLDLVSGGNILLNIDEDTYARNTIDFINQLIIEFVLSFPASRINFCLVDIDTRLDLFSFSKLSKINTNILMNGIVSDDRQLENTIKDMEQLMYRVISDNLSLNNVSNIFEYNEQFAENPQSIHLFVLANYPSGMRDDIAKRLLKIIQNGNKAGIYTVLINNKACDLSPGYKSAEHNAFLQNVAKTALVINKGADGFSIAMPYQNRFTPLNGYTIDMLPAIVEVLKENAKSSIQKVIELSAMYANTDDLASRGKIDPSEKVLEIPIGKRGGEVQTLYLNSEGDGAVHSVVIGGTGSGKSNLLHTIIHSACYRYSPEEFNLYIIDFKGGVEFKYYEFNGDVSKQLPHIKVSCITNDMADGIAVLKNIHDENIRRQNLFTQHNVQDLVDYRALGYKLPRILVIIDEIQELLQQDPVLGDKAIGYLRGIFKLARAMGINILLASQNIPKVAGLKDNVMSQIRNRISLRLNNPDDAVDVNISPKAVKALDRPEKGLGVINDIYNNDAEFRVAFAEKSVEKRAVYSQAILDKWTKLGFTNDEPMFVIGHKAEASPCFGKTLYTTFPVPADITPNSRGAYQFQLGQNYVTGKPYTIMLPLRGQEKENIIFAGWDIEVLRDLMGYSLLDVIMGHLTNKDYYQHVERIYYANGEMLNPKDSMDLFNVLPNDFSAIVENVSNRGDFVNCINTVYEQFKARNERPNDEYNPIFVFIHSIQSFVDLLRPEKPTVGYSATPQVGEFGMKLKTLIESGSRFSIHFIISTENILSIKELANELKAIRYKLLIKGIKKEEYLQLLSTPESFSSLENPKIGLLSYANEISKIKLYRYSDTVDSDWYSKLRDAYLSLGDGN